jgi:hypothetical protein
MLLETQSPGDVRFRSRGPASSMLRPYRRARERFENAAGNDMSSNRKGSGELCMLAIQRYKTAFRGFSISTRSVVSPFPCLEVPHTSTDVRQWKVSEASMG